ncbi:MAG: DUF2269 domain-containing protein [Porticoccaceae bacterium]|nr:DUF2269 domain-containing protein [Porticoccaceae bacterium]
MHTSTKIIIAENIILFSAPPILWLTSFEPPFAYELHKLLHITGAVLFLGNIVVTGLWMFFADRTHNQQVIHFAAKTTNWMDVCFTGPGVILVFFNGLWLSASWGVAPFGFLNVGWLLIALGLFLLSGVIWFYLIFLQECFIQTTIGNKYPAEFKPLIVRWYIWGAIAISLPLISMALMIIKPTILI